MATSRCCIGHLLRVETAENERLFISLDNWELLKRSEEVKKESNNPVKTSMFLQKHLLWAVMGW